MCDKTVDTCPFVFYYVPNWCKIQEMWYWFDMYCFNKLKYLALCFTVSGKNIWYTLKKYKYLKLPWVFDNIKHVVTLFQTVYVK